MRRARAPNLAYRTGLGRLRTESLASHTDIEIGDQRLAREFGRRSPAIQKIAHQRFRIVSLTCGNVPPILASRTSPTETRLAGWGARTRTWEWRNQNPGDSPYFSDRIPKK